MSDFDTLEYESIQGKCHDISKCFNHLINEVENRIEICIKEKSDAILVPYELLKDISYRLEDGKVFALMIEHQKKRGVKHE